MLKFLIILLHLTGLFFCDGLLVPEDTITVQNYVFWPNATVPFYINPNHFDQEQALTIMTALSLFAFKTCLKFAPVMAEPQGNDHVMVFENPGARWKCTWSPEGHSIDEPHRINLGYECLKTPRMEMTIMKALGFPFEHNRASRDLFIDVQLENVEPSAMELFTKDTKLPIELRNLPYDVNSVTHFGDRDFSKNGHRTFIIKDRNVIQNRNGLSDIDLRKIQLVYGPECQKRDRQEKIELCQIYPGVARRKRGADFENENLRVNRDITPPPENKLAEDVDKTLNELGIKQEVEEIIDKVDDVLNVAIENFRKKYCNKTEELVKVNRSLKSTHYTALTPGESKLLNITAAIADYVQTVIDASKTNLSHFCLTMDLLDQYGRTACHWGSEDPRCPLYYRSTKSGAVKHQTQHRPILYPSTKHKGQRAVYQYGLRSDNVTDSKNGTAKRKREAHDEGTDFKDSIDIKADKHTRILDEKDVKGGKKGSDRKGPKKILRSVSTIKNVKKRHYVTRRSEDQRFRIYSHTFTKADDNYSTSKENAKRKKKLYHGEEDDYNDEKQKVWYYGKQKITSDDDLSSQEATKNNKKTFKDDSDNEFYEKKKIGISNKNKYEKIIKDDITSREKVKKIKKVHRDESDDDEHERIKTHKKDRDFKQKINREGKNSRPIPRTVTLSKANKEFYADRKWPGGVVRYVITEYDEYDLPDLRSRLEEVNNILREKTCVRLQEISEEQAENYEDYLVLDTSPDYVTGRVGGRQVFGSVELFKGVSHKQHTAMMVMAMLGFYFEVSRHDRDDYIVVHNRHIRPDKLHHFEKIRSDATLPVPYDYNSATHPSWQFWRKIGKTGISSVATFKDKDPDGSVMKELGQHSQLLSDTDILKINSVYGVQCFKKQQRHRL